MLLQKSISIKRQANMHIQVQTDFDNKKNWMIVYWWLYHCAIEINTSNCTSLTYVNSYSNINAQIHKCRSTSYAAYMKRTLFCMWTILMSVPKENTMRILPLLSQTWGITWIWYSVLLIQREVPPIKTLTMGYIIRLI